MLHIRPIPEEKASSQIQEVYTDVKNVFGIEIVPLVFQYLAGFEEYFFYVWEKIKQNVTSTYFVEGVAEVSEFSNTGISHIYRPSRAVRSFMQNLHPAEREHIQTTVQQLESANAQLLLITLGMREGLKGIEIGVHLLPQQVEALGEDIIFDQFINNKIMYQNLKEQTELEPASRMLAPLFGGSNLMISKYPSFFSYVAAEMDELVKTELYLHTRVGLEKVGMLRVHNLPYQLGTSYAEVARFAGKKPYFDELLYILSETFPTRFPRLVLTIGLMHCLLNMSKGIVVQ